MKKILLPLLAFLLIVPSVAFAGTFRGGEQVFLPEVTNDDVYAGGSLVQIENDVNGDVVVAGGKVTVNAKISQDLTLGGGNIDVSGEVGDDVKIAGGNITVMATIKDDLFVAGGNVDLTKNSFVGGDLVYGAGNMVLGGTVAGNVTGSGGNLFLNGEVKGNLKIYPAEKIVFGPQAKVGGDLTYYSAKELEIREGIVAGKTVQNPLPWQKDGRKKAQGGRFLKWSLFSLLSTLFFGLFMLWIFPFASLRSADQVYKHSAKTLGIGLLVLILTPIAALLFLVTGIGLPTALVLIAFYAILLYFGKIMAAALIGWKLIAVNDKSGFGRMYGGFALGALLLTLFCLVPIIGWIIKGILILMALGGMTLYRVELFKGMKTKKLV